MRIDLFVVATALTLSAAPAQEAARTPDKVYGERIAPFLAAHCRDCHAGEKPKGDFRLDHLDPAFAAKTAEEQWRSVQEQLRAGSMPPKKKTRPPEADVRAVVDWIDARIGAAESARRAVEGRVVLRRLNRIEYANTIRDLLDVKVDLKEVLALDSS